MFVFIIPERSIFIFECLNDGLEAGEHLAKFSGVLKGRDVDLHIGAEQLDPGSRLCGGLSPPGHHGRGLGWGGAPGPRLVILLNTVSIKMGHLKNCDEFRDETIMRLGSETPRFKNSVDFFLNFSFFFNFEYFSCNFLTAFVPVCQVTSLYLRGHTQYTVSPWVRICVT